MSLKIKIRAASQRVTWLLGTRMPKTFPFVFVVGYPKSGTTWVCQLLSEALDLPFPRYTLLPVGCPAVVHGHDLMRLDYPRAAYVLRDGRDVMVSLYFYLCRNIPNGDHPRMSRRWRHALPGLVNKDRVVENLPRFIARQAHRPDSSRFNWADHAHAWFNMQRNHAALLRYEDLLYNATDALRSAVETITGEPARTDAIDRAIEKYDFSNRAGRKPGQEDRSSFLRSGTSGDWRNYFNREAAEVFDEHFGHMLIQAGYETDQSWVTTLDDGGMNPASAIPGQPY